MTVSSIYLITCDMPSGHRLFYVGQSTRPSVRWSRHKWLLKAGRHHNARLQAVYTKYGQNSFSFQVMETVTETVIDELEQWWLDEMHGWRCCLNISRDVKAPTRGFKFTQEMIEKARKNRKPQVITDEMRLAFSIRFSGENHPNFGKSPSTETREKLSASKSGRLNHFFGKSGENSPVARSVRGVSLKDGNVLEFKCIADAKKHGFNPNNISSVCSGRRKSHGGYSWNYLDFNVAAIAAENAAIAFGCIS